ncbi:nitrilase-related carbon-nitrogen hydrolase [Clostridium disporicum]|uniref:Nitrilase/cyanide hydratase and apolipoprotein N-acyltransferase n=1 Tax=Clostridium disporicum TaxID=84024 RepID=A0A173XS46_9CLOT|nr:nitrilase-related carbon-nitrogen hydrolase [Clostridium disporicum]CUN54721.1 Nitrilase/cyanide hydratase and apolipoprotein N-acyltransferase [Clostridium disporicum]
MKGKSNMKVALCQINIEFENKEYNKKKIMAKVKEAKNNEANLCLFPEMTLTGFGINVELIGEKENKTIDFFRKICIDNNINVGFGWVKKINSSGENHFTIINYKGEIISDYIKIHPFSFSNEDKHYLSGEEIVKCTIDNTKLASFICYDLRFPEIFQCVSNDVDIIIVSANWPQNRSEHWKTLLKARAIENQVYILGVNCVGKIDGLYYSGDSCIIDPNGQVIESIENVEGIIYGIIDLKEIIALRKSFPVKSDRKNQLYNQFMILNILKS